MYTIQKPLERKLKLCCLPTCIGNRYDLVHKFPMNNERAKQWIEKIDLPELRKMPLDKVRMRYFICSKHFRSQDYKNCESRSLNTTAYPRLFLKSNGDEQSEQCSSNSSGNIPNTEEHENTIEEKTFEISETIYSKGDSSNSFKKMDNKTPIQYVLYSPDAPLVLNKNRTSEIQAKQKIIPIKVETKIPQAATYANTRFINNEVQTGNRMGKIILKRSANYSIEPVHKKLNLIKMPDIVKTVEIVDLDFNTPSEGMDSNILLKHIHKWILERILITVMLKNVLL